MPLAEQPHSDGQWRSDVERRLRILEATSPLTNASIQDGRLRVLDADLDQRIVLGKQADGTYGLWVYNAAGTAVVLKLDDNGLRMLDAAGVLRSRVGYISASAGYGASVFDENGDLRFEVNDDGYRDPWLAHPWRGVISPAQESTTSGSWTSLWRSRVELLTHKGAACTAAWITDAGTTAEIRLSAGGGQTSAVSLAAASSGIQQFQWLHGLALGAGPIDFELQARVTGGAGSVRLDEPMGGLEMADPGECDADGVP